MQDGDGFTGRDVVDAQLQETAPALQIGETAVAQEHLTQAMAHSQLEHNRS